MIRVGIVGAGIRGHLFAGAISGYADVVGIADTSASARSSAESLGVEVYDNFNTLLDDARPDAIIVATPDFAHREVAVAAAERGVHLLIEKPLATSLADAYAIEDAVRKHGVSCVVGFENRWNPHFLAVRQGVEDGSLGQIVHQAAVLSNSYYVPTTMLSWAANSSPVWFLMPHTLDLACWLSGSRPVSVFARGTRGLLAQKGIDTWDVVHASFAFEDGSLVDLTSAWVLPEASSGIVDFRYDAIAEGGAVHANLGDQGLTVVSDALRSIWPLGAPVDGRPVGPPVWMAQKFVQDLEMGTVPTPGLDAGLIVTEALCAVEESLRTGQVIRLADITR